jgi:hypothetical protein
MSGSEGVEADFVAGVEERWVWVPSCAARDEIGKDNAQYKSKQRAHGRNPFRRVSGIVTLSIVRVFQYTVSNAK